MSLTVEAGEIRGIVGPERLRQDDAVQRDQRAVQADERRRSASPAVRSPARSPYRLAQAGIARTFQNLRLFSALTVRENLLVALDHAPTLSAWRYVLWPIAIWRQDRALRARADDLLDRFGLTAFGANRPGALPYGIQRRVEIARAMAREPKLLLLDEPAAGLNGDEVRQLSEIVRSIRDSGVTVVLIEHNMGLVMSLCERVTVLASGQVIAEGTPAEVAVAPAVIEAYLGDSMNTDDLPVPTSMSELARFGSSASTTAACARCSR